MHLCLYILMNVQNSLYKEDKRYLSNKVFADVVYVHLHLPFISNEASIYYKTET